MEPRTNPTPESGEIQLAAMLRQSRATIVFTGAGISTESGIPDYRGPNGVWTKFKPVTFQAFLAGEAQRRIYWQRKFAADEVIAKARPNLGHRAVADMMRKGPAVYVITQNIDGLHQASGIPEEKIVDLHGNTTYAHCLDCRTRYELADLKQDCGGLVKTATISFGQPMPEEAMRRAHEATLRCDLFLAVGSSLTVSPANGFPTLAKRNGARLVILNREATDHDPLADLVLHREAGPTLAAVVDEIGA